MDYDQVLNSDSLPVALTSPYEDGVPSNGLAVLPPVNVQDPARWPYAPSAVARRGYGYDGKGASGDSMASAPGIHTWHGRQARLDNTSPDAIGRSSGLDWGARAVPLGALVNGSPYRIPGSAIVRADTGTVLGVVGPDYSPLQPSIVIDTAFELARELGTVVGSAGSFAGGRDVWALIQGKLDPNAPMGPGSTHTLLHTGMDGTSAFSLTPTHIVVCCQNTLAMTLGQSNGMRLRHIGPIADRVRILAEAYPKSIDNARKVLAMIEASDVLTDLREDEIAAYACLQVRGTLAAAGLRQFERAQSAPENQLAGRSSVAKVVQIATWVGSHGSRSTARSLYLGAHRQAVNGAIARILSYTPDKGRESVREFRKMLEESRAN